MQLTKSYFSIFAEDFELMKSKLKSEEIIDMLSGMSDLCMFGETQFKPKTKPQEYFWEKILAKYNKDLACYNASVENGKKGGRPSKNKPEKNPEETQNKTQEKPRENPDNNPNQNPDGNPEQTQTKTHLTPNTLHLTSNNLQLTHNTPPKSPPREKKEKEYSQEFLDFWKECPKRISKDDANKKFTSILAEGKATYDELLDGIKRYAEHCAKEKTEPHYIKHPSTWLNQGCWKDEYPVEWKTIDEKPNAFDIFNQAMDEIERRAAQ